MSYSKGGAVGVSSVLYITPHIVHDENNALGDIKGIRSGINQVF